ncbi:hypothetical protein SM124_06735 [Bacillus sp. 31A1R]|uniref:ABM domain-containing protein n=1 Tax=Robertmurraya mangrovi TaxID=3098077 RepID=A0ABU5IWB0_9BACI|nr:hypothetical protein [Bacillus sp. 31A1R]MDZ5471440.1 hypothetical protein [Bacillus sp. 31A1R]
MFVKVYQYHIQTEKVKDYLALQEKVAEVYKKYIHFQSIYLQSKEDETKWIEIMKFQDEGEYEKSIKLINQQEEIISLYKAFQTILVKDKKEISEEDFLLMLQM